MSSDSSPRSSPPPPAPSRDRMASERALTPPGGIAPTPSDSHPEETGRYAVAELGRAETPVERATRIAEEARKGVKDLWEHGVGTPPQPHIGFPGSGLWKTVAETNDIARETRDIVMGVQGVKDKWSVRAGAAVWEVFKYLLLAVLAAAVGWMSGGRAPANTPPPSPTTQQAK